MAAAPNYDKDIEKNLDKMRSDIAALNDAVKDLVSHGTAYSQAHVRKTANGAAASGQQLYDGAAALSGVATDMAKSMTSQFELQIARNPLTAVIAAMSLGYVCGLMRRH